MLHWVPFWKSSLSFIRSAIHSNRYLDKSSQNFACQRTWYATLPDLACWPSCPVTAETGGDVYEPRSQTDRLDSCYTLVWGKLLLGWKETRYKLQKDLKSHCMSATYSWKEPRGIFRREELMSYGVGISVAGFHFINLEHIKSSRTKMIVIISWSLNTVITNYRFIHFVSKICTSM